MRKIIAMLLCLTLLLCGCGSTEASAPATADSSAAAPASEISPEEPSVSEENTAEDPTELAKQIWAMADEAEENVYAADYDLSMKLEMEMNGETTSVQSSIRSMTIDSETDPMSYTKTTANGEVTEVWYGNGTFYQSNTLGRYSVPMSYEDFENQEDTADEDQALLELEPENFGKLSAVSSDNFYTVTFSQPTLETWVAFADLLGVDDNTVTCSHFDLDGSMQCDKEGNVTQVKLEMELSLDIMGITTNMTVTVNQLTMGVNEQVSIELPNDEEFVQMSDLSIPTALATAQLVTAAQPSLQYQNIWALVLTGDTIYDAITQNDLITYVTDETGLQAQWDRSIVINDETAYAYSDVYAEGSGVITDTDGESQYDYDDESMMLDITNFIFGTSEAMSSGTDFTTEGSTLTFNLTEEYAETKLLEALTGFEIGYIMTDGTVESLSGDMVYIIDDSGLLLSQLMTLTAEVTYEGEVVTITLMDGGDVLAIGSDVVMP